MAKSTKLSAIGGIAVAGAALGLYLGSSAVSEINPAYYSTPSSRSSFHADLVPNQSHRPGAEPLMEAAVAEIGLEARCAGCGVFPDELAPGPDSGMVDYGSPYAPSSSTPTADLIIAQAEEHASRALSFAEIRDINRYSSYPVSLDEEEPELAETGPTAVQSVSNGTATPGL
ncbi:MAG TPA: hypothetical protein VGR19_05245 [Allosphingosinicella sp.]|nr:hypothetical protein [Allosphingosinicella sp.]